ncbi:glutaredoxin 2 isoform 1 [Camelus ferus]|nr:glutaredoxin 2 isoform 1 [Camelus ferus]
MAPVTQIQETISDNCVVIFSKTSCSYCTMAKKLFHDMNVHYKVVELDMLEYGSQFQDALYRMTGERTVSDGLWCQEYLSMELLLEGQLTPTGFTKKENCFR